MKINPIQKFSGLRFILLILIGLNACQKASDDSAFLKGPYLQNVKTDGITIMWESKQPAIGRVVFGKSKSFDNEVAKIDSTTIHEVILTGLDIETVYHYQVISETVKSKIYTFKTGVRIDSPFSFATYGDNKNGPFNHEKIANLVLSKQPNFVIHNGDLVNRGYVYKQWEKLFFTPARKMMYQIPLFIAIGNHEEHAKLYYDFFSLPHHEKWYSFDFGNAHFIVLDSDIKYLEERSEQLKWLIEDLERNTATWTFVNFHHVLFAGGGNYYTTDRIFRKNLLHPIFEKYGVDIVMNGHAHYYERSYPIVSKQGKKPITYIVCGNGGTPMRYIGKRESTLYSERVFGFVLIHIDGTKLHLQSININGEVIDEFALDKGDPQSVAAYEKNKIFFENIYDPVEASEFLSKGKDLLKRDNFSEALPFYEKAYHADSTCAEALAGMAECDLELGQLDKAMQHAKKSILKMSNYPQGYEVIIGVYVSQKKYDQALELCRKWLLIEPDKPDANETMAEIYDEQEKYDLAIQEMKNALAINPAKSKLYFELGELYEIIGEQKQALATYQKGLEWFMDEKEKKYVEEARKKVALWTKKGSLMREKSGE